MKAYCTVRPQTLKIRGIARKQNDLTVHIHFTNLQLPTLHFAIYNSLIYN